MLFQSSDRKRENQIECDCAIEICDNSEKIIKKTSEPKETNKTGQQFSFQFFIYSNFHSQRIHVFCGSISALFDCFISSSMS